MDFMGPIRKFDRYQQRTKGLAIPIAVWKKFGNDQGGNLAALVAYYAFFSIFPLLLVMTTILGFILQHNGGAAKSIEGSVLGRLPVIGQQVSSHTLSGSVLALVIGVITSLLGGLGVTSAAQNALDKVWAVPFKDRPNFLTSRLRGIGMLVVVGLLFVIASAASGVVSGGLGGAFAQVAGYVFSLAVNVLVFLIAFRFMTARTVVTRDLWIGAVVAGVMWTVLQAVGGTYVNNVAAKDKNTYGTFAIVIALLVWLHLGAQLTLYAAEINVVLKRKLWPRSLFGPPEAAADQKTLTAIAKVEERSDEQHVAVRFHNGSEPQEDAPTPSEPRQETSTPPPRTYDG